MRFSSLSIALWCCLAIPSCACAASVERTLAPDFSLRDFLGRAWTNELVRFALSPAQLEQARAGRVLVAEGTGQVSYQIAKTSSGRDSIEFLTDLDAYQSKRFWFTAGHSRRTTDLAIEETRERIQVSNSRIAVALRKRLAPGQGPIEAMRLGSGKWIGDSILESPGSVISYSIHLVSRGPVFIEVACRVEMAGGRHWTMRVRVHANEPVILFDESFSLADESSFAIVLNRNFHPDNLLYRYGKGTPEDANAVGRLATWSLQSATLEPVFVLEPWLHWWESQRQGTWFGLFNDVEDDVLAVGAREPSAWVDLEIEPSSRNPVKSALEKKRNGDLRLDLPLKGGKRKWLMAALDRKDTLAPLRTANTRVAPLPQQYLVKHGDFPLARINDYVLAWPGDETNHPRLMVQKADIERLRGLVKPEPSTMARLARSPVSRFAMDEQIRHYLASGDQGLGERLSTVAIRWVQDAVDMFFRQDTLVTMGSMPHHQTSILTAMNLADVVWSSPHVSEAMRERLKAQVAFLAYTVSRPDYWSPERGFAANPNMTTTVATFQSILACMIPSHPMARAWIDQSMRELKDRQLEEWSDENGGWLEAPHYAMVAYDHMLGAFLATYNGGFNDHLYHPKMKKVIEWLAKISSPPDERSLGHRHHLPIGNTYIREPSGEFGTVAFLWRDRDPQFASEMQWMHRQHGSQDAPGIGGFFATLAGYRKVLFDASIPEKPPRYASEWFPRTGVILRNGFPTARETQLHLIAGTNHAHYDRDSGSFTLWGKGRLIADDFGYYGHAPGDDHNMVVSARAPDADVMRVTEFRSGEHVDYVRAVKNGAWTRQVIFMKDPDPLASNYIVLHDRVESDATSTWRIWFSASAIRREPHGALIEGGEDIDTEVFLSTMRETSPSIEEKTRTGWGLAAGKYGRVSVTQKGMILGLDPRFGLTTILFPRLKGDSRPAFTSIADGRGARVKSGMRTDYVFLSAEPFEYRDDVVDFKGTVGAIQVRAERKTLWLGRSGSISAFGESLRMP